MSAINTRFVVLLLAIQTGALAQVTFDLPNQKKKSDIFSVSFQTGIGVINPEWVNRFISDEIDNMAGSGFVLKTGSSDIKLAAALNLAFTFRINQQWKLRTPLEYGGAYKEVHVNNTSIKFSMNRFSTGALGYYYYELAEDAAIFLGGGLLWHSISFQTAKTSVWGPRGELGISWLGRKVDREVFLLIDNAKGITGDGVSPPEINFTGVFFGLRLSF